MHLARRENSLSCLEMMDGKRRPCDSYFYSGAPSYYKLKYQIYHILSTAKEREPKMTTSSFVLKDRLTLERILDEAIDIKKVHCHSFMFICQG